jgi:carbon-monoxide dehydrogenase medium subunit
MAFDLLASNPEAYVIAGGQRLIPVLAFRLATMSLLVDLRRLPGLGNIALGDDGFRLGALVRWRDIEHDERLKAAYPLLHAAVAHVAHYQIRNRGTVGGSLAHADPTAELPGVAVTCDGEADRSPKDPSRLKEITDTVNEAHGSAPRTSRPISLRADYLRRERRSRPEVPGSGLTPAVAANLDRRPFR